MFELRIDIGLIPVNAHCFLEIHLKWSGGRIYDFETVLSTEFTAKKISKIIDSAPTPFQLKLKEAIKKYRSFLETCYHFTAFSNISNY